MNADLSEWDMREELLKLQQASVLWDDERTEDQILHGDMNFEIYETLHAKLRTHRARPDMRGVYSQTDMSRFLAHVL